MLIFARLNNFRFDLHSGSLPVLFRALEFNAFSNEQRQAIARKIPCITIQAL